MSRTTDESGIGMLTAEEIERVRTELATALGALDRAERIVFAEAMRGRDHGESTYIRRKVKRAKGNIYGAEESVNSEARCLEEFCNG